MADGVDKPESNNRCNNNRQEHLSFSESKSVACKESEDVNVGDPNCSRKDSEY